MFGGTFRLGRVLGVEVKVDASWIFIAALITWSLAGHYFPMAHPGWGGGVYLLAGVLTAALFFLSILAHELSHSIVSRRFGRPVRSITLFFFGGATELQGEPRWPREELLMALAGPATSLVSAGLFGALWLVSRGRLDLVHAITGWLAWINLVLGVFNLVPGFPLDGGRVFRAIVWSVTGDPRRATRIAAGVGRYIGLALIGWGVWSVFGGDWANGLWIALIGWFLHSAAAASMQELVVEDLLAGHRVREAMAADCPRVPSQLTLDAVVDQVATPSHQLSFPVVEGGRAVGLLSLEEILRVPRKHWATTHAGEVMQPVAALTPVQPDEPIAPVFTRMMTEGLWQLPVVENGEFVGAITRVGLLLFARTLADAARGTAPAARP